MSRTNELDRFRRLHGMFQNQANEEGLTNIPVLVVIRSRGFLRHFPYPPCIDGATSSASVRDFGDQQPKAELCCMNTHTTVSTTVARVASPAVTRGPASWYDESPKLLRSLPEAANVPS